MNESILTEKVRQLYEELKRVSDLKTLYFRREYDQRKIIKQLEGALMDIIAFEHYGAPDGVGHKLKNIAREALRNE